jgi:hypothetical protein
VPLYHDLFKFTLKFSFDLLPLLLGKIAHLHPDHVVAPTPFGAFFDPFGSTIATSNKPAERPLIPASAPTTVRRSSLPSESPFCYPVKPPSNKNVMVS